MSDQAPNDQSTAILKELSDIKSSLAVNTDETANIKQRVTELQVDVKEIKNDFINRREFNEQIATLSGRVDFFQKIVYSVFSVIGIAVLAAILRLVIIK